MACHENSPYFLVPSNTNSVDLRWLPQPLSSSKCKGPPARRYACSSQMTTLSARAERSSSSPSLIQTKVVPMTIDDLVGLGRASEKLLDVISKGCGILYRPTAIRREAEAEADKVRLLGKANLDVEAERSRRLPVAEVEGKFLASLRNDDLMERARRRFEVFEAREIEGQENLEAIAEQAFAHLPATVSEQPVDADWRRRFFQIAENICEDDMRRSQDVSKGLLAGL
jgi:hypothetical protein